MWSRILVVVIALLPLCAQAESVYVQNDRARILKQPGFRAATVAPLSKGTELRVLSKRKFWYRVRSGSDAGWVFSYQVSKRPPMQKVAAAIQARPKASFNLRRRASVVTTVGAVRGLSASDRARASADGRSDYLALEKMDALALSSQEVSEFLREGVDP